MGDVRSVGAVPAQVRALNARWVACGTCDALLQRPSLREGQQARCTHCGSPLFARKRSHAERTLALMIASLVVYAVAVMYPFIRMERSGMSNQISVIDSVSVLWRNDMHLLALASALLILLFPLMRILLLCGLAFAVYLKQEAGLAFARVARLAQALEPWSMVDIFMLGIIVSLVKVGKMVDIELGAAFWGMTALVLFLTMGASAACRDSTWQYLRDRF